MHPLPAWPGIDADSPHFESRIGMTVSDHKGGMRVTSIVATIRFFCADISIRDQRIVKMSFRGPRVSKGGKFSTRIKDVTFEGTVHNGTIEGVAHGGNHECGVDAVTYKLKRRRA